MITVNGMASDVVPATDRGLAYGDGVFRTLAVRGGRPVLWARQYAKLATDCARLRIACPSAELLHEDVVTTAGLESDAAVKIIVTRGAGERGYRVPHEARPNRIVLSSPLPAYPDAYRNDGIAAMLCETRLGTQPALAGVKHLNRLENVLARAEWGDDAHAEGIVRDQEGRIIGGTMSNVFIVEGDVLVTPDLARCGVAGLTRDLVIERCAAQNVRCAIEAIPLERLLQADETFVANSLIGVWPVRSLGGRRLRTGPMSRRVGVWVYEAQSAAD